MSIIKAVHEGGKVGRTRHHDEENSHDEYVRT